MKNGILRSAVLALYFFISVCVVKAAEAGSDEVPQEAVPEVPQKAMAYGGFTGGMMIHGGYVTAGNVVYTNGSSETFSQKMAGVPVGLGGALKVAFGKHLRVGGEGYVTRLNYGKHKSHASVGWGGVLVEGVMPFPKFRLFAGAVIGGGSMRHITLFEDAPVDFLTEGRISYRKYAFMAVAPYIGADIPLTDKMAFVLKADCLFAVSRAQKDFPLGPKLFFGIMFGRVR